MRLFGHVAFHAGPRSPARRGCGDGGVLAVASGSAMVKRTVCDRL